MRKCRECGKEFEPTRPLEFICSECRAARSAHFFKPPEQEIYPASVEESMPILPTFKKVCPVCGKEFETSNERRIYCSVECKQKKFSGLYLANKPILQKVCSVCGKAFETHSAKKIYCSRECGFKAQRLKISAQRAEANSKKPLVKCANCGVEFRPKNKNQICCSNKCLRKRWKNKAAVKRLEERLKKAKFKKPARYVAKCVICGKEFESSRRGVRYCSQECRNKRNLRELVKKICPQCGKEFEARGDLKKYCSRECLKAYWGEQRQLEIASKPVFKKVCPVCGKEFETKLSFKKYCSLKCQNKNPVKFEAQKVRRKNKKKNFKRKCLICGAEFETRYSQKKTCSQKCSYEWALRQVRGKKRELAAQKRRLAQVKPVFKKVCPVCGKEFETLKERKIYCSDECYAKANKQKTRERLGLKPEVEKKICANCGAEFSPKNARQVYCSEKCYAEIHAKQVKDRSDKLREVRRLERLKALQEAHEQEKDAEALTKLPVLQIGSRYKEPPPVKRAKPKSDLERTIQEAQDCGLSYGKYRAMLATGKTYEELKREYERDKLNNVSEGLPPFLRNL